MPRRNDIHKVMIIGPARRFKDMGFRILATQGIQRFLQVNGVESDHIRKMHEGRPHIVDGIKNGEIHLIINTSHGKVSEVDDSYIRKNAVKYRVTYITTAAALATAIGIEARRHSQYKVKSLQVYHSAGQNRQKAQDPSRS